MNPLYEIQIAGHPADVLNQRETIRRNHDGPGKDTQVLDGLLRTELLILASSGCKNLLIREEDLLARIEEQLGASDEAACEQIEKILVYPDGRFEIETK